MNKFSLLLVAILCVSGCTTTHRLTEGFDEEYAKELTAPGPNIIKGSALMRQQGGGVVTCAGLEVGLIPKTAYAAERVRIIYGNDRRGFAKLTSNRKFTPDEPGYWKHTRKTLCNAQGFFEFADVADGEFFVTSAIIWTVNYASQGGALMQSVSVKDGQVAEVVLSP